MSEIPPYITARTYAYSILKQDARSLRAHSTEAESALWQYLRGKQLGYKFRRQHIIDQYIVDFICLEKKLIIEVDGKYHLVEEQIKQDAIREEKLKSEGYQILRFSNEAVTTNIEQTIECIKQHLL